MKLFLRENSKMLGLIWIQTVGDSNIFGNTVGKSVITMHYFRQSQHLENFNLNKFQIHLIQSF